MLLLGSKISFRAKVRLEKDVLVFAPMKRGERRRTRHLLREEVSKGYTRVDIGEADLAPSISNSWLRLFAAK